MTGRYTDIARGKASPISAGKPRASDAEVRTAKAVPAVEAPAPDLLTASTTRPENAESEAGQAIERALQGLTPELARGAIMTGATPHRLLLFTFDDGPDRNTTPLLLDRLDAAGVRAVFFLTGANLRGENLAQRKNQQIARETVARGHFVASHTMNHKQLPLLSDRDVLQEVVDTEQVFERVLGARPWLIRPPGGAHSQRTDRLLASRGYTTMLWNLGAGDFQVRTAKDVHDTWRKVFERRESEGQRGGIILLHDTYSWSVDAFQLIVQDVLDRNCELLKKGEELYDFVEDPSLFFEALSERDASTVAMPMQLSAEALEARQVPLRAETRQRCESLAQL